MAMKVSPRMVHAADYMHYKNRELHIDGIMGNLEAEVRDAIQWS